MAQQELETSDNFLPRSEPALESPTMTKSEEDVDLILDGVEKLSCHIIVAELHWGAAFYDGGAFFYDHYGAVAPRAMPQDTWVETMKLR